MEAFLEKLRRTYGNISIVDVTNHQEFSPYEEIPLPQQISKPKEIPLPEENPFDTPAQRNFPSPKINIRPSYMSQTVSFRKPVAQPTQPPAMPFKISPVNIATQTDWIKMRAEVIDVRELKNFFAGKTDNQSPAFLKMIETYCKELERELALPQEIDEESSYQFVENLAGVIKKRLYTVLKSYQRGISGKGIMPVDYYRKLEERVNQYFNRIGLKTKKVSAHAVFHDVESYMEIQGKKTSPHIFLNGKVAEVLIQPYYFEYHDETGEVQKYWIDGQCIVYAT